MPLTFPQAKGKRALQGKAREAAHASPGSGDAMGVVGLFGMIGLMGLCCGVLPLVLAGVITVGALAAGLPWIGGAAAALAAVGLGVRWRRRRLGVRARGP